MAQHNRLKKNNNKPPRPSRPALSERPSIEIPPRKPPRELGKPFTLLEDAQKNVFQYRSGAWIPFAMTMAQCREEGDVKELPQKINKMTRYEVRLPLGSEV